MGNTCERDERDLRPSAVTDRADSCSTDHFGVHMLADVLFYVTLFASYLIIFGPLSRYHADKS